MSDWVISSVDQATMHGWAQAMGFWANGAPVWQGDLPDASGQYFLNEVGITYATTGNMVDDGMGNHVPEIAAQPGWWARLRLNGNDPFAAGLLDIPEGVTVYPPVKYLADGVTIDPNYTQPPIGVIA